MENAILAIAAQIDILAEARRTSAPSLFGSSLAGDALTESLALAKAIGVLEDAYGALMNILATSRANLIVED